MKVEKEILIDEFTAINTNLDELGVKSLSRHRDEYLFSLIKKERLRQESVLRMIPSENYVSQQVLEATGSELTNKYSEGYPGKRYYQGLEVIDIIEKLTIARAMKLFGAEHANVQPYSGSIAMLAACLAVCEPGNTIMGPRLDHGGHLSHGHGVNISGKLFKSLQYGVSPENENFDFEEVADLARKNRPQIIIAGGTAFPRQIDFKKFGEIARQNGAIFIADISHLSGLIAGGAHPNPFPYADIVVSTSHKTLRGPRGAFILCKEEFKNKVDKAVFPLIQGGPHQHTQAGISATFFEAMQPQFKDYVDSVIKNSKQLAEILLEGGLRLVTGGTDTHLILADVTSMGWEGGKAAAIHMEKAGIVVNANMIPFDKGSALKPSGIRLGVPALTTRGFKANEISIVGDLILRVLDRSKSDSSIFAESNNIIRELCSRFPVPEYFV